MHYYINLRNCSLKAFLVDNHYAPAGAGSVGATPPVKASALSKAPLDGTVTVSVVNGRSQNQSLLVMFLLSGDPAYASFTVRPVNKATDRPIVREIFRQEFYGDDCPIYPHESLWEIYDGMDTSGVFGAYLVCRGEQILFLLEIHPAVQMDLSAEHSADPGSIVIYCFFYSRDETIYLPAFRACIASLLDYPGINRILTSGAAGNDTTGVFLEKTGFSRLPDPAGTLPADGRTRDNWSLEKLLSGGILFASPPSFTE